VVYAKKPFVGPAQVLAYLGRYTHAKIASCRALLVNEKLKPENTPSSPDSSDKDAIDVGRVCPDCGGAMHIIERIFPASLRRHAPMAQCRCDTS